MISQLHFRRYIAPALVVSSAIWAAGCSMHPVPESHILNFPRASTFDIVQRVRCEAKAGVDSQRSRRSKKRREHIEKIIGATVIGYDFELVMTEDSSIGGGVGFLRPTALPSKRKLDVDVGASSSQTRANTRNFRIIEPLADVANIKAEDCPEKPGPNLAYPISGSLSVDEVVRTYIRLERISDLEGQKDDEVEDIPFKPGDTRPGVFSETLRFQTELSVGATPTLTLKAVAGSFRLNTAQLNGTLSRKDKHTLIVAFAQARDFKDEQYNRKVREARAERRSYVGWENKLIRGARTEAAFAQASAEYAINQCALELSRVRNLLDDEEDSVKFLGQQVLRGLRPPDETGPGD
jgi:hypothetical protein